MVRTNAKAVFFFALAHIAPLAAFCFAPASVHSDIDESLYPHTDEPVIILKNSAYVAAFSDKRGVPLWVGYVAKFPFEFAPSPHPRGFFADARLERSPTNGDYRRSGYDKGHLAPNYAIARGYGKEAQRQTFLLSNILPQSPKLNRGVWKRMEEYILERLALKYGRVLVFAGPVYAGGQSAKLRGAKPSREIDIPESAYMVVAVKTGRTWRVAGFVAPQNPELAGIWEYARPVREIERLTGLDFFKNKKTRSHDKREVETELEYFKNIKKIEN